jgi:hypothetical protein
MKRRYRVRKTLRFADFTVAKGTVLPMASAIPTWTLSLLVGCVPLRIRGKIRIVAAHQVTEMKRGPLPENWS